MSRPLSSDDSLADRPNRRQSSGIDSEPARVDHDAASRSTSVDRYLELLRKAMADTGWTFDALKASLEETLQRPVDKGYLWRMFNGEKPWQLEYLLALPDDLEARFEQLRAESFGLIVVAPLDGIEAQKAFVAGLIGILATPKRAVMAKADLSEARKKKTG